jgi:hypothetical protein
VIFSKKATMFAAVSARKPKPSGKKAFFPFLKSLCAAEAVAWEKPFYCSVMMRLQMRLCRVSL